MESADFGEGLFKEVARFFGGGGHGGWFVGGVEVGWLVVSVTESKLEVRKSSCVTQGRRWRSLVKLWSQEHIEVSRIECN